VKLLKDTFRFGRKVYEIIKSNSKQPTYEVFRIYKSERLKPLGKFEERASALAEIAMDAADEVKYG